jgi:Spy/CpxP family protein refolding chaperone
MNPFTKLAQTCVNLLTAMDTTINMANRLVNSADHYVQTVERHASDYNYSSHLVSLKRREQLEEQYKVLTPEQKKLMESDDPFAYVTTTTVN